MPIQSEEACLSNCSLCLSYTLSTSLLMLYFTHHDVYILDLIVTSCAWHHRNSHFLKIHMLNTLELSLLQMKSHVIWYAIFSNMSCLNFLSVLYCAEYGSICETVHFKWLHILSIIIYETIYMNEVGFIFNATIV